MREIPDAPPLAQDYRTVTMYRAALRKWQAVRRGAGCRCKRCPYCWDILDAQGRCMFIGCAALRKKQKQAV